MLYKIKKYRIVPDRAGSAGRDSDPNTARLSCRAGPDTINGPCFGSAHKARLI